MVIHCFMLLDTGQLPVDMDRGFCHGTAGEHQKQDQETENESLHGICEQGRCSG